MELHLSDPFLMTLVHCVRNVCKKHVKFDNLVAVSGYICLDVDGTTQQRFVLNELLTKTKNSEGHSFPLKVVDWDRLKKKTNTQSLTQKSSGSRRNSKNWSIRTSHHNKCDKVYDPVAHPSLSVAYMRQNNVMQRKCGRSTNHFQYPNARKKINSQTFTLKDFSSCDFQKSSRGSPTRTFSNTTINVANQSFSARGRNHGHPHTTLRSISNERKCKTNVVNKCKDSSYLYAGRNTLSNCKSEKHRSNVNDEKVAFKEARSIASDSATVRSASFIQDQLLEGNETLICSPDATSTFNVKATLSSNSDASDVSIGSTKPRYLVQNSDELLVSCPKPDATTDQIPAQILSQSQIYDDCTTVPSPAHISSLISTIIHAISRSSSRTWLDASVNTSIVSANGNQQDERDHVSLNSCATLGTMSSLEGDLPPVCKSLSIDTDKEQEVKKKLKRSPWRITRTESQQMSDSSSNVSKKRGNIFKWMRLFKRDSNHLTKGSVTVAKTDSPVSLQSCPSLPDSVIIEENSRKSKH